MRVRLVLAAVLIAAAIAAAGFASQLLATISDSL